MSSRSAVSLEEWRRAVTATRDECPYVGARPQSTERDGESVLIGREDDRRRIRRRILSSLLLVLHGESGVGKTSLLLNALTSDFEAQKFSVLLARTWGAKKDAELPRRQDSAAREKFVEEYLWETVCSTAEDSHGEQPSREEGRTLSSRLADIELESLGGAVLILDQFEEVLRETPMIAQAIVAWIIELGYRLDTRVVVSLRTDSIYRLDPLLRGVRPFSMDRVAVEALREEEHILGVMSTSRDGHPIRQPMSQAAAKRLYTMWAGRDEDHRPPLLELQATLYALFFHARDHRSDDASPDGPYIHTRDLESFEKAFKAHESRGASDLFAYGLQQSVQLKLRHIREASRGLFVDDYLIEGTREFVRRAAPLLSVGGFKVPVPRDEFALRVLDSELRVLGRSIQSERQRSSKDSREIREFAKESFKGLDDPFSDPGEAPASYSNAGAGSVVQGRRLVEMTAGPQMAGSASSTLIAELRRVSFAIEWLRMAEIVSVDTGGTVRLIHDRAGEALISWARTDAEERGAQLYALHQLTASQGEHYEWDLDRYVVGGTGEGFSVYPNLNWRECRITASFRHVVFVNCDFTASRFSACRLEGVTFLNCLLDDANFENCSIVGKFDGEVSATSQHDEQIHPERQFVFKRHEGDETSSPELESRYGVPDRGRIPRVDMYRPARTTRVAPSFLVSSPSGLAGSLLFSDTSGAAAVEVQEENPTFEASLLAQYECGPDPAPDYAPYRVQPTRTGVVVTGGRICYLTLYRCQTAEGSKSGTFAFHHVSGDGLSIVEHHAVSIEMHDAALRGLAFSRDREISSGSEHAREIEITGLITSAALANVYFSGGLKGSVIFYDCNLISVLNVRGGQDAIQLTIDSTRFKFLVNTLRPANASAEDRFLPDEKGGYFLQEGDLADDVVTTRSNSPLEVDLERMDFRYSPADWEIEQRRRVERESFARREITERPADTDVG